MFDNTKSRRQKLQEHSSSKLAENSHSFISAKKALQNLSLSFYGQDTMKKSKQVIFDNCDILDQLPQLSKKIRRVGSSKNKTIKNPHRASQTQNRDNYLKIDSLFVDEKVKQIQLANTTSSQFQDKNKERLPNKKKIQRSISVKAKQTKDKLCKPLILLQAFSARCKTSKCVNRKSNASQKKSKKK